MDGKMSGFKELHLLKTIFGGFSQTTLYISMGDQFKTTKLQTDIKYIYI